MRTYNHLYRENVTFSEFLNGIAYKESERILVRVHSSIHTHSEITSLLNLIKKSLPTAQITGCSTTQVICLGQIHPRACLISVTILEKSDVVTTLVNSCDSYGNLLPGDVLAKNILKELPDYKKGFMLIFFPLFYSRIQAVVAGINSSGRDITLFGGTSVKDSLGGPGDVPFVISGTEAATDHVSIAFINAENLYINGDYSCGVESVGRKSPIVCEGTTITQVSGDSAGEWYANLLGKEALDRDPGMSDSFPVVAQEGRDMAYHVTYQKDDEGNSSLLTFPELSTGTRVSPGFFHPQKIYDQLCSVIDNISSHPAETIFMYDCTARTSMLSNCAKWEVSSFASTDASGALLAGEVLNKDSESFYANLTFVTTALSETKDDRVVLNAPDVASISALQEDYIDALNFLLVNTAKSLDEDMHSQQEKIRDAVFYNPAVGIDNQLKFQYDNDDHNFRKVSLFHLNNEKMLRLFSGITETYAFLTDCYEKVNEEFFIDGIYSYSFQDTSIMIAGDDQVSKVEFESITDRIHDFLNHQVYEDVNLSYTTITIHDTEDPLTHLDLALDYAIKNELKRVRYNEVNQGLEDEHENIHTLLVIREAISHKRVIPYFQEIHDNLGGSKRMFESLMRIKDEDGKVYFPDKIIPIAKEFSLYNKLSEMMVETVIDMFWGLDARVTLNLNVQDIYNRDLIKVIFDKMKHAPHPENYVFELVESEEITDYEYIKRFADRIHEYGGKIAIDDFGSGFSNMLHVMRIDADYIKIDELL